MREVTVRYESSLNNFLTYPFEIGVRHIKVAFCNGSQKTFLALAKERIIYRPLEKEGALSPLTKKARVYHLIIGVLETVGYLTVIPFGYLAIIAPFVAALADRIFNKPWGFPKGCYEYRTHRNEGGSSSYESPNDWRKNPFDANGKEDPFYQGASWIRG